MTHVRQNVWELGDGWADPILWYARGVRAMKARPLADPLGWRFYAAIHGIDARLWQRSGDYDPAETLPSPVLRETFWDQCQHGSWYFLPWHRGYVLAFEANVRAEVVRGGGPSDWALPYWDYFKRGQSALPSAFASPDWPDGTGDNPLFVAERYGPYGDGNVIVPGEFVNLKAMQIATFAGVSSGASPGFGGVDTGFAHGGQTHGELEAQPHDTVHGLVGGGDPRDPRRSGLMADPDTAGLDPIFWLHHTNIDRLWEAWRRGNDSHVDPSESAWANGPAFVGERPFAMPMPDGSTWTYTPAEMSELSALGYRYDDVATAPTGPIAASEARAATGAPGGTVMGTTMRTELVGATLRPLSVEGDDVRANVALDESARRRVAQGLTAAATRPAGTADRTFLNLENVRGLADSTVLNVYVGVPNGTAAADRPDLLAGNVALFGVRRASLGDDAHGGQGLTFVLEITPVVDRLHASGALDVDTLSVRLVPVVRVPKGAEVTVGRISVVRQGR